MESEAAFDLRSGLRITDRKGAAVGIGGPGKLMLGQLPLPRAKAVCLDTRLGRFFRLRRARSGFWRDPCSGFVEGLHVSQDLGKLLVTFWNPSRTRKQALEGLREILGLFQASQRC
eukprot:12547981-Alexandrium_andersonii.AAC.1